MGITNQQKLERSRTLDWSLSVSQTQSYRTPPAELRAQYLGIVTSFGTCHPACRGWLARSGSYSRQVGRKPSDCVNLWLWP